MQFNKYTHTHKHAHTLPLGVSRTTAVVAVVASRVACTHPGGWEGSVGSPLPFLWGTNLHLGCDPGGTIWATGGIFWAGFDGIGRAPPTRDSNGPASMAERERRARSKTAGDEPTSGGKVRLGDNPSRQLDPLQRGPGHESRRFFLFRPDLR